MRKRLLWGLILVCTCSINMYCGSSQEVAAPEPPKDLPVVDERERLIREQLERQRQKRDELIAAAKADQGNNPVIIYKHILRYSKSVPEVQLFVYNNTPKTVGSYEIEFRCYDDRGRPVRERSTRSHIYVGVSRGYEIEKGDVDRPVWNLRGMEKTTNIKRIRLKKVSFTDGTSWRRR
ncbi:MAG TPA: hypothetical protein PK544_02920 [Spirochaetota bacterium]|nr:hypothetical protein [Spirochaetota bacterium]HPQ52877.1 hypothetical protein [Spirochaetota bacterium]